MDSLRLHKVKVAVACLFMAIICLSASLQDICYDADNIQLECPTADELIHGEHNVRTLNSRVNPYRALMGVAFLALAPMILVTIRRPF